MLGAGQSGWYNVSLRLIQKIFIFRCLSDNVNRCFGKGEAAASTSCHVQTRQEDEGEPRSFIPSAAFWAVGRRIAPDAMHDSCLREREPCPEKFVQAATGGSAGCDGHGA